MAGNQITRMATAMPSDVLRGKPPKPAPRPAAKPAARPGPSKLTPAAKQLARRTVKGSQVPTRTATKPAARPSGRARGNYGSTSSYKPLSAQAKASYQRWLKDPTQSHDQFGGATVHMSNAEMGVGMSPLVQKAVGDWATAAQNIPAGVALLGSSAYKDVGDIAHGREVVPKRLLGVGKDMAKATWQDVRHPLRHPGFTALDLLGAASLGSGAVARGAGAVGKLGEEGSIAARVGAASRALASKPTLPPRTLRVGQLEAHPLASRSVPMRAAQAVHDRIVNKAANDPKSLYQPWAVKRVGKELQQVRRTRESIERAPAGVLIKAGKKLTPPEQAALRAVAEGTHPLDRVRFHLQQARQASSPLSRRAHLREAGVNRAAADLFTPEGHLPPALAGIYNRVAEVAKNRDDMLTRIGKLGDEQLQGRIDAAAAIIRGADQAQGHVRIPYARKLAPRSLGQHGGVGSGGTVGIPRTPGSLTHEFKGGLLKSGRFRGDTTRLVGESNLEAQRYGAILRARDQIIKAGHDVPQSAHDIPVRLDNLKRHPFPELVQQYLGKEEGTRLSPVERHHLENEYDSYRQAVFMKHPDNMGPEEQAQFAKLAQAGKVKWVNKQLLGDMAKQPITLGHGKTIRTADAINNATRAAMLYLKPAYAAPNILGNVALNLVQQGFAAPRNLARAVRLNHAIGPDVAKVDSIMGEGIAQSVAGHEGLMTKGIQGLANVWSKGVDTPFRRAAFLHEAKLAGVRTPAELKKLLNDPASQGKLIEVARRANREIIDYGNMGPFEKNIIRRIVFLYPWTKGSTAWAKDFALEHPAQHAAAIQTGREGKKWSEGTLGPVPSYLEGSFKLGGKLINPASAAILGTPAQVAEAGSGLVTGKVPQAAQLQNFLTPLLGYASALATRKDSLGRDVKGNALDVAKQSFMASTPLATLIKRLTAPKGSQDTKLFSYSKPEAFAQFGLGSIAPRTYNPAVLRAQALKEQVGMMAPDQRVRFKTSQALKGIAPALKAVQKLHPDVMRMLTPDKIKAVRTGYQRQQERDLAFVQAAKGKGVSVGHLSAADKFMVTLTLAQKYGYSADLAAAVLGRVKQLQATKGPQSEKDKEYRIASTALWHKYGYSSYVSSWEREVLPLTKG